MALDGPPSYYFNGIDFNSSYFNTPIITASSSSGGGITQAQADVRYLNKVMSDTSSVLETFNSGMTITGGLTVDTISPTVAASSPSQIGWNQNFSGPTTPTLAVGTTTGANILWTFNTNGITTGTPLPIGTYFFTISGVCVVPSGITAGTIATYSTGYATGSTYTNTMARSTVTYCNDANYGVMTKTAGVYPYSTAFVVRNTVANNYIAGYLLVNFSTVLTGGTYTLMITSYSLTRIA
jgi:hypothetical protein